MAISITWATKVIYIPQSDLTFLGGSLYELDVNQFRLNLKNLEDDEEGMPFPDTHRHNTEVVLSGITYARIVEIINGYTVEFEDGQYTVSCVGVNHNLADVKVANQVALIVNNAAGLISMAAIEFSSFEGGVHIDVTSSNSGTVFPTGTPQAPVNNLADALLIAQTRGFQDLHVMGVLTLAFDDVVDGYHIVGTSHDNTTITVISGASTEATHFEMCTLTGALSGNAMMMRNAHVGPSGISGFSGHMDHVMLVGDVALAGVDDVHLVGCYSGVPGHDHPDIDMGGSGRGLGVRGYHGGLGIHNLTGAENISLDFDSGQIHIHSDVTAGLIVCRGIAKLTDDSGGTAVIDSTNLINSLVYDLLGVTGENIKWTGITHDSNKNMTGATLTQYTDKTLTTIRKSWSLVAAYNSESELTTYQLIED